VRRRVDPDRSKNGHFPAGIQRNFVMGEPSSSSFRSEEVVCTTDVR
jgi:hypothetical protein